MCRLLGWASARPTGMGELLDPGQLDELAAISRFHPDGWGMAVLQEGETGERLAVVRSTVAASEDPDFASQLRRLAGRSGVVHLRRATAGFEVDERNTHPFCHDECAFIHNGSIPHPELLDTLLRPEWSERLQGATDSERYFLLVLQNLEDGADVAEAFASAVAEIGARCGAASLNAMLLSPGRLVAVQTNAGARAPLAELLEQVGGDAERLPRGHCDAYYELCCTVRDNTLLVSSTGLPDEHWATLPPESVLVADPASGCAEVLRLGDAAPLQRLSFGRQLSPSATG